MVENCVDQPQQNLESTLWGLGARLHGHSHGLQLALPVSPKEANVMVSTVRLTQMALPGIDGSCGAVGLEADVASKGSHNSEEVRSPEKKRSRRPSSWHCLTPDEHWFGAFTPDSAKQAGKQSGVSRSENSLGRKGVTAEVHREWLQAEPAQQQACLLRVLGSASEARAAHATLQTWLRAANRDD